MAKMNWHKSIGFPGFLLPLRLCNDDICHILAGCDRNSVRQQQPGGVEAGAAGPGAGDLPRHDGQSRAHQVQHHRPIHARWGYHHTFK